jgi:iron complex transport system permease protein
MGRSKLIYLGLFLIWALGVFGALIYGPTGFPDRLIFFELRLPRVILANLAGISLAVSGAVLQVIFNNSLCDPYTLGVSSGAALGAVIGFGIGKAIGIGSGGLLGAVIGSILVTLVLVRFSKLFSDRPHFLLLAGVMLGFLGSSLVAIWTSFFDAQGIQSALGWMLGDLTRVGLLGAMTGLIMVLGLFGAVFANSKQLDLLLLGPERAKVLGLKFDQLFQSMILFSSLMVAVSVSLTGMIGFVGLLVPHFARKVFGSLHQRMLLGSAILGSILMIYADWLSRAILAPFEIPVGAVTALIGAPFFIGILIKTGSKN